MHTTKKGITIVRNLWRGNSNKSLYRTVNKLLDRNQERILPSSGSDKDLADSFATYFSEKISKIRAKFKVDKETKKKYTSKESIRLSKFEPTTEDELKEIIQTHGVKTSPEDPIPAPLLKANVDKFLPIWTQLVNWSLESGSLDCLRSSVTDPLIKELDGILDSDNYKNYRPVSNLIFLEKLIERVVAKRLNSHMTDKNLHCERAFGYKSGHSTESLLLVVCDELLTALDQKKPTIVLLLDLSATFDRVDQEKLLRILCEDIGIDGVALDWLRSFLTERTQRVKINDAYSDIVKLLYGVTQGSVLGPILFNIYIRPLYPYIAPILYTIFGFADDHQLLKQFVPFLQVQAVGDINQCLERINNWMNEFFLCLNAKKTKILIIKPPSLTNIIVNGTFVDGECIRFVKDAKNLGVILDEFMSFEKQVVKVAQTCFYMIKKIAEIKSFLSYDQLKTLICTATFSNLDYCNALYYGIGAGLIKKLQSVQNSAIYLLKKRGNIINLSTDEILKELHWLPVKKRIIFKMLLMVHQCLHQNAPKLLMQRLEFGDSSRTGKLVEKRCNGLFGERSFSVGAPKLWNMLPLDLRAESETDEFKKKLKTFLFTNDIGCF